MKLTKKNTKLNIADVRINYIDYVDLSNTYHICPECGEIVVFTHNTTYYGPMTDKKGVNVEGNTYKCSCGCMYHVTYDYDESTRRICNIHRDQSVSAKMSFTKVSAPVGELLTVDGYKYTLSSAYEKLEFSAVERLFEVGYFNSESDREKKRFYKKQKRYHISEKIKNIVDIIKFWCDQHGYAISVVTTIIFILGLVAGFITLNVVAFGGNNTSEVLGMFVALLDVVVGSIFIMALAAFSPT